MVVYLKDTDAVLSYSGAAWVPAVNTASIVDGNVTSAKLGAGTILQVVSVTKTDTFSTSSGSLVDITGLSASITPRSTASKVLIFIDINQGAQEVTIPTTLQLVRDSTNIAIGDADGSRLQTTIAHTVGNRTQTEVRNTQQNAGQHFLDSPNTISATTYKVQIAVAGGTGYINRSHNDTNNTNKDHARPVSSITLMEVAG